MVTAVSGGAARRCQTRRLAERLGLATLVPGGDLASLGYCLANVGREYAVYLPDGGEVTVDLSAARGKLRVEWIHPVEGALHRAPDVEGGAGHAAIHRRRK